MKWQTLIIALILILVSWSASLWYNHSAQLEEPIFLDHYYDGSGGNFELKYLVNKQDPQQVQSIVFSDGTMVRADYPTPGPLHPGNPETGRNVLSRSTHYWLVSAIFDYPDLAREQVDHEGEATIHFTNGESARAEIGTVHVKEQGSASGILQGNGTSSQSGGRSAQSFVVEENIKIEEVSFPFPETADDFLVKFYTASKEMTSSEQSFPSWVTEDLGREWEDAPGVSIEDLSFPLEMERDSVIKFTIQHNPESLKYYQFGLTIKGTTAGGNSFTEKVIMNNDLTPSQIEQLVERRQE